jgi:hypothetical protein
LLQLPVDIILYLCREHLPPSSAAAFSLSCKALFALVFSGARRGLKAEASELQDLLLMLEKDHGHGWWYCHGCALLHPISSRGPTGGGRAGDPSWVFYRDPVRPHHSRRWLEGSGFSIDYQTVRLAMNRHFLGPGNGLPLENFNVKAISTTRSSLPWQEKWSARIVLDELFLSATRTLSGAGWADEPLRAAFDGEWREICGHVRTSGHPRHTVDALLRPTSGAFFTPCRGVVGSCRQCLMDYTVTVERKLQGGDNDGEQATAHWFITITSYHQLGSGRSHLDPKWAGFGRRMTAFAWNMKRDMVAYPPGAVKAGWDFQDFATGWSCHPETEADVPAGSQYLS